MLFGLASRMRSEQSDEQSAEQLQEVKHPKARIAHRGSCAIPDTILGSHRLSWLIVRIKWRMSAGTAGRPTGRRDLQRQYRRKRSDASAPASQA
jgi:hypothetical protein